MTAPVSPVRTIPGDENAPPPSGIALCLSGGGYRAMVFHLGALWRLNELGFLPKLARISSVSGGSITAGALGLKWKQLQFDATTGISPVFAREVVDPVRGTPIWPPASAGRRCETALTAVNARALSKVSPQSHHQKAVFCTAHRYAVPSKLGQNPARP